jgi:hypothetical protein
MKQPDVVADHQRLEWEYAAFACFYSITKPKKRKAGDIAVFPTLYFTDRFVSHKFFPFPQPPYR